MKTYVHPEPVDLGLSDGTRIWIYRYRYLHPDAGPLTELFMGRYQAYTGRYPEGSEIAAGTTISAVIRRARRRAQKRIDLAGPVDVSAWTRTRNEETS